MAHIVLEGSGVMPIVGELVTSGVPEHVRVDRERELGSFSGPSVIFRNPAVVAGPPRSVMKTYRVSIFSRCS
jgi:hypothetical protein